MADSNGPRVLTSEPSAERYSAVVRVLYRVLVLNLGVAIVKIILGYFTGAVSILSDGFHSLTDAASNVVALVGVSIARRPPDADHPYGHRKYETFASLGILVFLILVLVQVLGAAYDRLVNGGAPRVFPEGIGIMAVTLIVWLGYPLLDPVAAVVVAVFIGRAGWAIAQEASRILADEIVIAEGDVRSVVATVPAVLGCHQIRTRGSADHVFMDLHVWLDGRTSLDSAHATSHVVKDLLMRRFPHVADVVIHIEPPPDQLPTHRPTGAS